MNKQCPKCNQSNPPEAAFCLNCAAPLAQAAFGNQQANQQQQQWNQPNYGGQQQSNFAQPTNQNQASQRATTAMILAIAGFFCCGVVTGVPAIIVGWMEVSAIKTGQSSPAGMTFAQVGLWGGVVATVLHLVGWAFWLFLSMAASAGDPYYY